MRTICIIQARMNSTRLPGKVLLPIAGKPIIQHVWERCKKIKGVDDVFVALASTLQDRVLWGWLDEIGAKWYMGNENNLISRYLQGAVLEHAGVVMRITSDCPFLSPKICSWVLRSFIPGEHDFVSNCINRTFPDGYDCEVLSQDCLRRLSDLNLDDYDKEHVTTYIYSHLSEFRTLNVSQKKDESKVRLTLDTWEDYERLKKLYPKYRLVR